MKCSARLRAHFLLAGNIDHGHGTGQIWRMNGNDPMMAALAEAQAAAARGEVPVGAYSSELCPECSSGLAHIEGCEKCFNCGYSKC